MEANRPANDEALPPPPLFEKGTNEREEINGPHLQTRGARRRLSFTGALSHPVSRLATLPSLIPYRRSAALLPWLPFFFTLDRGPFGRSGFLEFPPFCLLRVVPEHGAPQPSPPWRRSQHLVSRLGERPAPVPHSSLLRFASVIARWLPESLAVRIWDPRPGKEPYLSGLDFPPISPHSAPNPCPPKCPGRRGPALRRGPMFYETFRNLLLAQDIGEFSKVDSDALSRETGANQSIIAPHVRTPPNPYAWPVRIFTSINFRLMSKRSALSEGAIR